MIYNIHAYHNIPEQFSAPLLKQLSLLDVTLLTPLMLTFILTHITISDGAPVSPNML
jgi:hypothetical protein